ncbi:MAG: hypothetical protein JWP97_1498 [Labilithrix sp.]|nr:hypothetical protein [Labilithrix sp.]
MQGALAASRWGILPAALVLTVVLAVRLGALAGSYATHPANGGETPPLHERALLGATFALGVCVLGVRLLGAVSLLTPVAGIVALALATFAAHLAARRRGVTLPVPWRALASRWTAPLLVVSALGLLYAFAAAYLLPVWQWDAIGYHLPYVDFVLQDGSFASVPDDVPYLSTYPHAVELLFAGWRMMLPDDRLVDAAQLPLGLFGGLAVAAIARQQGARAEHAIAAAVAWLTVPALWLQLPTNYIDVSAAAFLLASAFFVLAVPTPLRMAAAGAALGLLLGSKPNAPIATTILFVVLAVRAWRTPHRQWLVLVAGLALVLGSESFVVTLVRHHNPIWPVHMKLGPFELPGTLPMSTLLESGANAPRLHGFVVTRVLRSWATLDAPPVFDMRYGGMGALFLLALPAAVFVAVKKRAPALLFVAMAALASPDPAVPRYVLAVPGLAFALAAPLLGRARERFQQILLPLAAVAAAVALWRASPGLVGEGPPLADYLHMSEQERADAVGADGRPTRFTRARERLQPGEITLFDASMDLPYLAWPTDLSRKAGRIADGATAAEITRLLDDPRVRLLVVGDDLPAGAVARERASTFLPLFHCKSSSCTVYARY